jgi:hypothetical protein
MSSSPGFLLFLAGIAAAAGTTLITGIPIGHEPMLRAMKLVLCSMPWFLMSWVLARTGATLEDVRRRIDLRQSPLLGRAEMLEIEQSETAPLAREWRRATVWCGILFVTAIVGLIFVL